MLENNWWIEQDKEILKKVIEEMKQEVILDIKNKIIKIINLY